MAGSTSFRRRLFSAADRRLLAPMTQHPVAAAMLILALGFVLAGALMLATLDNLRTRTALENARSYAVALGAFRDYYMQEIVPRAAAAGVEVRHDYRHIPGALPAPATLSIELGEVFDRTGRTAQSRFYSAYPYPWRENGGPQTVFEAQALARLTRADAKSYVEVDADLSGGVLRYAEPVVMRAGCVGCHNTHASSPKTDWKTGDVRGVQAVSITLPPLLPGFGNFLAAGAAPKFAVVAMTAGLILTSVLLFGLLQRLKRMIQLTAARNRQLDEAWRAAEAANAGKSRIMANVSHELRTPLNAIIGFSDMIARETLGAVGNERYRAYAVDIRGSGERLLGIIDNMVDFAEIDSGDLLLVDAVIDLSSECARVCRTLEPLSAEHGVAVAYDCAADLPALRADRRALRHMLVNLVTNAVKYAGAGARAHVTATVGAGELCIGVSDTGVGIAADDLQRILQPFERAADPAYANVDGIGLGLSIVRELAALHGGALAIRSEPGRGTHVTISFPAWRTVPAAGSAPAETAPLAALP